MEDLKTKLKLEQKIKSLQSELNSVKKLVGASENFKEEILKVFNERLNSIKLNPSVKFTPSRSPDKRQMVVVLNDLHYGTFVDPEEVNNLNSFGWTEASRRTAKVINEAINFKPHNKNKIEKCHLIINGDVLAGTIHNLESRQADLMVMQVNGALHILANSISALAKRFPKVEVSGLAGNHDRVTYKNGGNRAISEIYDSYTGYIYYALSCVFKDNKNITFNIPKGLFVDLNLPGGRALITHGDSLFSGALGNPGRNLSIKNLSDAIHRFNLGEIKQGKSPFKLVIMGHVHTETSFTTNDGVLVKVCPSLIGLDTYAMSLGINHSFAAQLVFESVPSYICGDSRMVNVSSADKDKNMDKIIPLFKRSLRYEK